MDTHACTILVQLDSKDPSDKMTRVMIELKISKDEMKKMQKNMDDTKELFKFKERQFTVEKDSASKYQKHDQATYHENKDLREKIKGNMSFIQAREIIWNDIIQKVKAILDYILIIAEDKVIVIDLESIIDARKEKCQRSAQLENKMINFLNFK